MAPADVGVDDHSAVLVGVGVSIPPAPAIRRDRLPAPGPDLFRRSLDRSGASIAGVLRAVPRARDSGARGQVSAGTPSPSHPGSVSGFSPTRSAPAQWPEWS